MSKKAQPKIKTAEEVMAEAEAQEEKERLEAAAANGDGGGGDGGEGGGEGEEKQPDAKDVEIARLQGRLEGMAEAGKKGSTDNSQNRTVTLEELDQTNEQQREFLEKQYGIPFDQIRSRVDAAERRQTRAALAESQAKEAVSDALEVMVEADPQVLKLKVGIKEYMADVPAADKLNPDALKRHLAKASIFAKGKLAAAGKFGGGKEPAKGGLGPKGVKPGDGGEGKELKEGDVGYGDKVISERLTLKIKPLISNALGKKRGADVREKITHPDDPNSVMIPRGFDEKPEFS